MTNPSPTVPVRAQILLPFLIALLVITGISPFVDVVISRPLHFGDYQERFHLIGLIYSNLPYGALTLVILILVGLTAASRPVVRGGSMAAFLIGVVMLALLPVFGLDFLQVRHIVPDNGRTMFLVAGVKTIIFAILLIPLLIWGGLRGMRATVKPAVTGRHQRTKGEGLIVAQDAEN